jgi:hypothetical protein
LVALSEKNGLKYEKDNHNKIATMTDDRTYISTGTDSITKFPQAGTADGST